MPDLDALFDSALFVVVFVGPLSAVDNINAFIVADIFGDVADEPNVAKTRSASNSPPFAFIGAKEFHVFKK